MCSGAGWAAAALRGNPERGNQYAMKLCASFTLCIAALLAAGCQKTSVPNRTSTDPRLTPVTLELNWFPEVEHGGYYAALVHGYYREAGLDVRIVPGGPQAPVVQQVATGDMTFGVANADNLLFGRAEDAKVVALFAPLQTSPRCLIVHESSGIQNFQDLKNITLAMTDGAAFAEYLRQKVPLENVRIVRYPGNVANFLLDKNYAQQGYVFSEPYLARQQGGDPKVLMLSDLGFNPYTSLLFTSEPVIAEKRDLVGRMVEASRRGWEHYLRSPEETNHYIHKQNPEIDLDALAYGAKTIVPLASTPSAATHGLGTMSLERWRMLETQLVETRQIKPGAVDVEQVFTTKYLSAGKADSQRNEGAD